MNCFEFEESLNRLVEDRGTSLCPDGEVHVQSCTPCAQLWRDHLLIEACLAASPPISVPATLANAVLTELLAGTNQTDRPAPSLTMATQPTDASAQMAPPQMAGAWGVVAAAVCLIAVGWLAGKSPIGKEPQWAQRQPGAIHKTNDRPGTETVPQPDSFNVARQEPVSSEDVSESVAAVLDDLKAEYSAIAEDTSVTAKGLATVLPDSTLWSVTNQLVTPLSNNESGSPTATNRENPPPERSSFGSRLGRALDSLWRAIPDDERAG